FESGNDHIPYLLKWDGDISIEILFRLSLKHPASDIPFYQPVLQGMIRDETQPPSFFQQFLCLKKEFLQGLDLLVHLNPDGLIDLGEDLMLLSHWKKRLQDFL